MGAAGFEPPPVAREGDEESGRGRRLVLKGRPLGLTRESGTWRSLYQEDPCAVPASGEVRAARDSGVRRPPVLRGARSGQDLVVEILPARQGDSLPADPAAVAHALRGGGAGEPPAPRGEIAGAGPPRGGASLLAQRESGKDPPGPRP